MSLWDAFYGRKLRYWSGIAAAVIIAGGLAGFDLFVGRLIYPVGYLLAVIAIAAIGSRRLLYGTALVLCFLTFAIYVWGPHVRPVDRLPAAFDFRLFNRSLAAIVTFGTALVLDSREWRLDNPRQLATNSSASFDKAAFGRLSFLFQLPLSTVLFISTIGFALVAFADFAAPAQFNVAILYSLGVVMCVCLQRRLLLWSFVLCTLLLTRLGFWLGPMSTTLAPSPYFLANRFFFKVCAVAVAFLTVPWTAWQQMDYYRLVDDAGEADDPERLTVPATNANPQPRPGSLPSAKGRPKRILFLDHTAALGGGEVALINLLRHLDHSRYHPTVALFADGPLVPLLRAAGIDTHLLPLSDSLIHTRKDTLHGWGLLRIGDMLSLSQHVARLAGFIRAGRFDLIHSNSLKSDIIGGLAGRIAGRTVLWHVRDRIDPDYLPRQAVGVFRAACCLLADYVVTNSRATLALLRPTFGDVFGGRAAQERMRVVHDGVVGEAFVELGNGNSDQVVVGLVGRISPFKGQDVFIRAAAKVLNHYPCCRFRIIGAALFSEEDYDRRIRNLVKELNIEHAIEFAGFRTDVEQAIAELDILVHASVTGEPFGQVIVEGMAAGKPVVATDGGGVPEIVEDGVTGLLVPMREVDAMADAVCRLLKDPKAAAEMGLRGRERVRSHFRIENTARKIERFYRHVFATRTGGFLATLNRNQTAPLNRLIWLIWAGVFAELAFSIVELLRAFGVT